jgi:hypothetical protein
VARKRISSVDLSWLISEELFDSGSRAARMSLAVVPDDKHGWRVIVATHLAFESLRAVSCCVHRVDSNAPEAAVPTREAVAAGLSSWG